MNQNEFDMLLNDVLEARIMTDIDMNNLDTNDLDANELDTNNMDMNNLDTNNLDTNVVVNRNIDWYCYILRNNHPDDVNKTYNGKTNDPVRRLKEHNEINCRNRGAKHTRRYGNSSWEFIAIIGYFPTEVEALRHEWRIKKPEGKNRNRKYTGAEGRMKGLNYALGLERFTSKCDKPLRDMELTIWVLREYAHLLKVRPELQRLTIIECDNLDDEYITNNINRNL
jgi:predicted GIY-YIG superfamily endonuclease